MCWHGYLGSPREYDSLAIELKSAGYDIVTPNLLGHWGEESKAPLSLASLTSVDLLENAWQSLCSICQTSDDLVLLGHSLGGVCSLILTSRLRQSPWAKKLKGVIALSAPYETVSTINQPLSWLSMPWTDIPKAMQYLPESFTGHVKPSLEPWHFPKLIEEANVMLRLLKTSLPYVDVPVCLMHSPYDLTVPFAEMEKLRQALHKAPQLSVTRLERCGHQIFPKSQEVQRVTQEILCFIESLDM